MNLFERLKNGYRALMYGRHGMDRLNWTMLALAAILAAAQFLYSLTTGRSGGIYMISITLVILACFRCFSRNAYKRNAESMVFSQLMERFKARRASARANRGENPYRQNNPYRQPKPKDKQAKEKERRTKVVACQKCGQRLRVPKGKGKIRVFCKNCGEAFEMKS